jgi:hypothetical protein
MKSSKSPTAEQRPDRAKPRHAGESRYPRFTLSKHFFFEKKEAKKLLVIGLRA